MSEAEGLEEVDVISLLATQSEVDEDEVGEEEVSVDPAVLEERLGKRNKSLKKSKQANHRMQDELSAQQTRIDELEKLINKPAVDTGAKEQERKEVLEAWRTEVGDNPEKAIDYANLQSEQMQDNVVNYISEMKTDFERQIAELKGATNPDVREYEGEIAKLKTNPNFANLPQSVLIDLAKGLTVNRSPRGSATGGKAVAVKDEKMEVTDEMRRAMGFEPRGE